MLKWFIDRDIWVSQPWFWAWVEVGLFSPAAFPHGHFRALSCNACLSHRVQPACSKEPGKTLLLLGPQIQSTLTTRSSSVFRRRIAVSGLRQVRYVGEGGRVSSPALMASEETNPRPTRRSALRCCPGWVNGQLCSVVYCTWWEAGLVLSLLTLGSALPPAADSKRWSG